MATVGARLCHSTKSRVRPGLAGIALIVVAMIVSACGSYYQTDPPEGFGFTRVRNRADAIAGCYLSAVLPDPMQAVDRLVEYYHSHVFGGGPSHPVYTTGECRLSVRPAGKRPNAYGWVGSNDPPVGSPTDIALWVTQLHPQGPARIHLVILPEGNENL